MTRVSAKAASWGLRGGIGEHEGAAREQRGSSKRAWESRKGA